jgi:DNA-binding protein HU-beta
MNKSQLVDAIAGQIEGGRSAATLAVDAVFDAIQRAVSDGERVMISGFGVFERVDRAARTARNPATGESVQVAETRVPKFRPGKEFKDYVSGARLPGESGARAVTAQALTRASRVAATAAATAEAAAAAVRGRGRTKATAATASATTAKPTGRTTAAGPAADADAAPKARRNRAAGSTADARPAGRRRSTS